MRSRKPPRLFRATFTCLDEISVPKIFMAMVSPHLEYGNVIWHPRFKVDKAEIEKVQRRATKLIPSLRHEPCEARLRSFKTAFSRLSTTTWGHVAGFQDIKRPRQTRLSTIFQALETNSHPRSLPKDIQRPYQTRTQETSI